MKPMQPILTTSSSQLITTHAPPAEHLPAEPEQAHELGKSAHAANQSDVPQLESPQRHVLPAPPLLAEQSERPPSSPVHMPQAHAEAPFDDARAPAQDTATPPERVVVQGQVPPALPFQQQPQQAQASPQATAPPQVAPPATSAAASNMQQAPPVIRIAASPRFIAPGRAMVNRSVSQTQPVAARATSAPLMRPLPSTSPLRQEFTALGTGGHFSESDLNASEKASAVRLWSKMQQCAVQGPVALTPAGCSLHHRCSHAMFLVVHFHVPSLQWRMAALRLLVSICICCMHSESVDACTVIFCNKAVIV